MATGTITNTILDPSGTAVEDVVVNARLRPGPGFRTGTFTEIAALESTTTDSNGDWSLTLEVNTDITPGDSYYEIEEKIPEDRGGPRVYAIQVASGSHTLYASLVSTPPSNSSALYLTQSVGDGRYAPIGSGGGGATLGSEVTLVGTSTATGTATTAAPSNHRHALSSDVAGDDLDLTAGVLHVNPRVPVAGDLPQAIGTSTVTGTTTTFARANHSHMLDPVVAGDDLDLTAGVLHVNPRVPVVQDFPQAVGTSTVTGTTTSFARANHSHMLSPAVAGSGITHIGGTLNAAVQGTRIQAVGTATATGTSTSWAADNHVHPLSPAVIGTGLALSAGVVTANVRAPAYVVCTATTTQVYTVPSGVRALLVQVVGAGGGGGGCNGSATLSGGAGGGGSGGNAIKYVTSTATAYSYNCGIKGAGATAGTNNGSDGTQSVFGHGGIAVTAKGGIGGFGATASSAVDFNAGGTGGAVSTGGDVNEGGQSGMWGFVVSAARATGGPGAASVLGGGGARTDGNADGIASPSHGAGGGGGSVRQVNTARAGGAGGDGLILILEFYGN